MEQYTRRGSPRLHHSWRVGFDQHVRGSRQAAEHVPAAFAVQIERDAALARIERQPGQTALRIHHVVEERTAPAQRTAPGRLDDDDVGTQIAEDLSREQAALVCEVEDAQAFEHRRTSMRQRSGGFNAPRTLAAYRGDPIAV
jgi:hypothetical protein